MLYQPENKVECYTILCKDCILKNPANCPYPEMRKKNLKVGV